jgi:hypothetical protein
MRWTEAMGNGKVQRKPEVREENIGDEEQDNGIVVHKG